MPVYSITSHEPISKDKKKKLVDLVTTTHCSIMVAPEQFVHVLFMDGVPLFEDKYLYIHANVRAGRSFSTIEQMKHTLISESAKILDINLSMIHLNLIEIQARWVMEGGYVMPEPGEEEEWMAKVTKMLAEQN